ncbi:LytTR family transcriptional regulator DNA-binding domain-containing protein [Brevibacillus halotolerans]|uniref:HTH LytTR-type domain-containing protein n=1 Tax=Brevibacillus laterosporus TaxID=1465 RepID=A0A0F7BYD9_BRELA|nr:LytTR family transcriptional regulator DNA-binding domain-containing protein [Brevibacillus halotolerans]AKF92670.1 hypothetical protein EX87_02490 [Brevibacillus laterosporus]MBA4535147.1 LytTR family transcriptional regulator DNA-binding domain-containing protein [Brevibacillus halotolerans]WPS88559.1 LytTR family transcriptional regulator DNA-binding domain-containing protein [Brevibacillus halotolerans]
MTMFSGIRFGTNDIEEFSIEEVNKVDLFRPKNSKNGILQYHTNNGKFLGLSTLEDVWQKWGKFGFMQLDPVNVVNLYAIKYIVDDSFSIRAYFEDGTYATVSRPKYKQIEHLGIPKRDHPD